MEVGYEKSEVLPIDILDDLSSRFIINVPEEERKDLIRICFQIELAHWFFLDFYCTDESRLKPCGMKEFTKLIFWHIPFLREHADKVEKILDEWKNYKMAVPTYGAILMDARMEKVLLVQGFWSKTSWGFPKGKVNEQEEPHQCAVREVLEETGYDMSKLLNRDEYLDHSVSDQMVRLYLITGVPKETVFKPKTRNEIKSVEWFSIADLPANKKDMTPKANLRMAPNNFFTVMPFVRPLRQWIQAQQKKGTRRHRSKTVGDLTQHLVKRTLQGNQTDGEQISKGKEGRHKSTYSPPPRLQKSKGQTESKNHQQRSPLNNNCGSGGAATANSRRSLLLDFSDIKSDNKSQESAADDDFTFTSSAWANFRFDRQALYAACFN